MKKYKHIISSYQLVKGSDKGFNRDIKRLEKLLENPKFLITDKDGNTFLINQNDIKPV